MVDHQKLDTSIRQHFPYNAGAFYGQVGSLALGAGLVYRGIRVPEFNSSTRIFDTYEQHVYVLTHECDVDQQNERQFNQSVLVCPITPIAVLAEAFSQTDNEGEFFGMLPDIAADKVFRVFLLPPGMPGELAMGGILELNALCSTQVSEFSHSEADALFALSEYGQSKLDRKLYNHLLRPKADQLPRLV